MHNIRSIYFLTICIQIIWISQERGKLLEIFLGTTGNLKCQLEILKYDVIKSAHTKELKRNLHHTTPPLTYLSCWPWLPGRVAHRWSPPGCRGRHPPPSCTPAGTAPAAGGGEEGGEWEGHNHRTVGENIKQHK